MKQYTLLKTDKFGIPVKQIYYDFKIQETNKPTQFIKIIVHHVGQFRTIQQIIDQHVDKNRWTSIGWHFMISKKGTIYYSRDLKYAGAHTFGYNKNSIGIALFGNLDEIEPSEKQLKSLKLLIDGLKNEFKIRKVLSHNHAIYDLIKHKFWKLSLPEINPIDIDTKLSYDTFTKDITTKILEKDASDESINLIKRLKSCPGFNMYKHMREIEE